MQVLAKSQSTRVNATKSGAKVVVSNGTLGNNTQGEPAILAISDAGNNGSTESSLRVSYKIGTIFTYINIKYSFLVAR